jgi:hypothetical protein
MRFGAFVKWPMPSMLLIVSLVFLGFGSASARMGLMGNCDFRINKVNLPAEDFRFYSDWPDPLSRITYRQESISSHPGTRHFWLFLQLGLGGLDKTMAEVGMLRQDLEHILSVAGGDEQAHLRALLIEELLESFRRDVAGKNGHMEVIVVYDPSLPNPNPVADFQMVYPEALYFYLLLIYSLEYSQAVDIIWSDFHVAAFVSSFTAGSEREHVIVKWTTAAERENLGFHLLRRSSPQQSFAYISDHLIPAASGGNSQVPLHYAYVDSDVSAGVTYEYQLQDVSFSGERNFQGTTSATPLVAAALPESYCLYQNYPNPFNASTEIRYRIPEDTPVRLIVYDVRGELVRVLVDALQGQGEHLVRWDGCSWQGNPVSSGLYFCGFQAENYARMMKMVLLR